MGIIDGIFRAGKMLQVGDGSFTSYAVNVYTDSINRSDHYVKGHPIAYYGMNAVSYTHLTLPTICSV